MTYVDLYMQERKAEKDSAVAAIEDAIAAIAAQDRQPDLWEKVALVEAISSVTRGAYRLAEAQAEQALVLPSQRSDVFNRPLEPLFDRCDLDLLKNALTFVDLEEVRELPFFGPIIFDSQ
jgi:hypothetical protein